MKSKGNADNGGTIGSAGLASLARSERRARRAGGHIIVLAPELVAAMKEAAAAGNVRRLCALIRLLIPQLDRADPFPREDMEAEDTDGRLTAIAQAQTALVRDWMDYKRERGMA